MANRLVDHIWVVDTAGADPVVSDTVYVEGVRWVGVTADASQAIVKNVTNDDVVWADYVDGADAGRATDSHISFRCDGGFKVTTLTASTTLYIYGRLE